MIKFNPTNESWSRLKRYLRATWRKLTDDDLEMISRDREQLVQVVRNRYCPDAQRLSTDLGGRDWNLCLSKLSNKTGVMC